MAADMDPRDKDTMKWLGNIIEVGGESNLTSSQATKSEAGQELPTSTSAATLTSTPKQPISRQNTSQSFAKSAALGAIANSNTGDFRKVNSRKSRNDYQAFANNLASRASIASGTSLSRASLRASQSIGQDRRQSKDLEAVAKRVDERASTPLASPILGTKNPARYSRASPDLSQTGPSRSASSVAARHAQSNWDLERGAAGAAATIAARDTVPYEVPKHRMSSNAGKAALLAAKDHQEYQVPAHKLAKDAGKAALLAHKDHVEYEVPQHELSANAGKAALLAANDHVEYEVPEHELSKNASTAALQAHNKPVQIESHVHQMSASASSAALLAHKEPVNTDIPVHQMSANAGKAALLAANDHEEYTIPDHELSASAGKAALLAHRESRSGAPAPNASSAAGAANALKAATQAHHDPAMRPTKPEDLQAKGAANALKAATQAHREQPAPFKYVHPADDPEVGKLARANAERYLADMEYRTPHQDTVTYAAMSYNNAKLRGSQSVNYGASEDAYKSAGLANQSRSSTSLAAPIDTTKTNRARASTSTSAATGGPADLMALARKNVDAQMAAKGLTRTESQATVRTVNTAANTGANLAFKEGQGRAIESERQREISREERDITERINREMAKFDQQRKRNENSTQVQSALMEAAKRNARLSLAQMDASRPYAAPNLREVAKMEDLLNEDRLKAHRENNSAQVDLGGGHYMSQADIEAVAARRIQPVFDEMDEHVATINRQKAELQARKEVEEARKAAEKAEKKKENELRKERERNTKEATRKAKEQKKAEEKAAAEKRKAEEKAAAEERRVELERKRAEEKAALEAKRAEEKEAQEAQRAKDAKAEKLRKADSTEAVAGAQTNISAPLEAGKSKDATPLPGTNERLPGQDVTTADKDVSTGAKATEPDAKPAAVVEQPTVSPSQETTPTLANTKFDANDTEEGGAYKVAPALNSKEFTSQPVATYQVENRGMVTDTEGETDDEWVDASEETPAIERAEYVNIGLLTDSNLVAHGGKRKSLDAETASNATAKPDHTTGSDAPPVPTLTAAQLVFAGKGQESGTTTRFKEDLA